MFDFQSLIKFKFVSKIFILGESQKFYIGVKYLLTKITLYSKDSISKLLIIDEEILVRWCYFFPFITSKSFIEFKSSNKIKMALFLLFYEINKNNTEKSDNNIKRSTENHFIFSFEHINIT